jgi:ECF sigma factor
MTQRAVSRLFPYNLINELADPTLGTIALLKRKGHTVQEIGDVLETSTRTIDRKLRLIRDIWEEATG